MLAAAIFTSSVLFLSRAPEHGEVCGWLNDNSLRIYKVANGTIQGECPPPEDMNAGAGPISNNGQREFLVQRRSPVLISEGFRSTMSPIFGTTAIFASIAATEAYDSSSPNLTSSHPRYYTKLRDDQGEILLTVTGNTQTGHTLTASRHYRLNGQDVSTYYTENLLPTDFSSNLVSPTVLELDTRINNDNNVGNRGDIRVQVCARRGQGSCFNFEFMAGFGNTAAPEIYLGSGLGSGLRLPVRYCNLPAFGTTPGSGYTDVCRGPGL